MTTYSLNDNKGIPLDKKLEKYLGDISNGFYIEAGSFDGLTQSNTKYLEDKGWRGMLIEPSIEAYNKCIKNRCSKNYFENVALVKDSVIEPIVIGDFNNGIMSSINGTHLKKTPTIEVKTASLNDLVVKNNIEKIDFLSLDVEGYELQALQGLFVKDNKIRPKYMMIEVHDHELDDLFKFLTEMNYKLIENISNYNIKDNPAWGRYHNDYLFIDSL